MRTVLTPFLLLIATTVLGLPWRSNGPAGGSVRMIAAAPSNPSVIYVTSTGGVFRSADAGATWTNISGPLTAPNLVTVDPTDPNVAYVTSQQALYKTSDGGVTWKHLGLPANGGGLTAVLVDPRNPNVVYVGSVCAPFFKGVIPDAGIFEGAGVYKSTDGGATFKQATDGLQRFQFCVTELALDPLNPDTLYSRPQYGDDGYARSDDGAHTWTHASGTLPGSNVIADPRNDRVRFGTGSGTLFTSADGGSTWSALNPRLVSGTAANIAPIQSLAIDRTVPRLFFGGPGGLFRSGDGGQTALQIGGPSRPAISSIVFDPVDGSITVGTDESVERSGGLPWSDWKSLTTGDKSLPMGLVVTSRKGAGTAFAKSARLYVTHDYGASWSLLADLPHDSSGQPLSLAVFDVDVDDTVFAIARDQHFIAHVFKLPAGSAQWIELHPPGAIYGIVADPRTAGTVCVIGIDEFVRSRDGGATWEIRGGIPSGVIIWRLAIDPTNSDIIHIVTSASIMKSIDGGLSWKPNSPQTDSLSHLTISPSDPTSLYVDARTDAGRRIYRSIDRGDTWTLTGDPPPDQIGALVADPIDPGTVYLSTFNLGIFRSRDGAATWQSINDGLPTKFTFFIAVSSDGAVLHASLNGMWELPLRAGRRRLVR